MQKALADGELREDLYYRLAVVQIDLPPLRDRAEDIQLLANEFLERFATQNGKKTFKFEDKAWDWILSYNWPGNVRELKNAIERAVILTRGEKISLNDVMPRHLRLPGEASATVTIPVGASFSDGRRRMFLQTLASTGGDLSRTAKLLGVGPDEVRAELRSLMDDAPARESASTGGASPVVAPKTPLPTAKKTTTKKR